MKKSARLLRWDGRRRSTRGEEPMWPALVHRAVFWRLALAFATTLAITALVFAWGPPFPYRAGEIYPFDLRVRVPFELVNHVELVNLSPPTEIRKTEPSVLETARFNDRPVLEKYPAGMMLVPRGTPISERQLSLLKEEHRCWLASQTSWDRCQRGLALLLIFGLIAGLIVLYVGRFQSGLAQSLPTISAVCGLVLVTVLAGLYTSYPPWHGVFLPLSMTAMILTLAYNPQFALLMSVNLALGMVVALGTDINHFLVLVSGLATVILLLRNVRTRTRLVKVACCGGFAFLMMTAATGILSGQTWTLIVADGLRRFVWGALAGFLLTGILPAVERLFNIITDISLLELADGAHPLLQELVRRAPGTYTHSVTVATLAEAAAESIGANALLTRVGSYFHDIGKMLKPHYFIENQNGENRHDQLEPALSTLIIIGHVKDGVALAKQYNLPRPIIDFIEQHHGTTLVEYFYREAMKLQESNGLGPVELEPSFRYPGPKPQNRENGILMLADAVESASRALHEPTPARINKLVHDLLMKRLLDGQFEECGLTLSELHLIEESLCKGLIALFHARIRYPEEQLTVKAS